jgi:hypothetical protein
MTHLVHDAFGSHVTCSRGKTCEGRLGETTSKPNDCCGVFKARPAPRARVCGDRTQIEQPGDAAGKAQSTCGAASRHWRGIVVRSELPGGSSQSSEVPH